MPKLNMPKLRRSSARQVVSLLAITALSMTTAGQTTSPGGVAGASFWTHDGDSVALIANYHTLNLLDMEVDAGGQIPKMEGATTLFLVLQPNFISTTGQLFLELGDVSVYDDKIAHGQTSTVLDFSDGNPKILTLKMQRSPRYKASITPQLVIHDSSMFSIAELIYYPHLKSRGAIRMVNTYLAIKYSIPITDIPEKQWRNYIASDTSHYWDFTTDKIYGQRVLGIGRSDDEDLFQAQTKTSHGSLMKLSVDTIKAAGQMPHATIDDGAFLILSERVPAAMSTSLTCDAKGVNPLLNWKLKPHQWGGESSRLYLTMDKPSSVVADSIWMTDGWNYTYLPIVNSSPNVLTYGILMDSLNNGLHYFFTSEKGNPCNELEITVASNELTVDGGSSGGMTLKTHNYGTGLTIEEPLGGYYKGVLNEGQNQVAIYDNTGGLVVERVFRINNGRSSVESWEVLHPKLKIYPNPVKVGAPVNLMIENLPETTPIVVLMVSPDGKLISQTQHEYQSGMIVPLTSQCTGLNTVRVLQGQRSYSVKMLVSGN